MQDWQYALVHPSMCDASGVLGADATRGIKGRRFPFKLSKTKLAPIAPNAPCVQATLEAAGLLSAAVTQQLLDPLAQQTPTKGRAD